MEASLDEHEQPPLSPHSPDSLPFSDYICNHKNKGLGGQHIIPSTFESISIDEQVLKLSHKLELLGYNRCSAHEMLNQSISALRYLPYCSRIPQDSQMNAEIGLANLLSLVDEMAEETLQLIDACDTISIKKERTMQELSVLTVEIQHMREIERGRKANVTYLKRPDMISADAPSVSDKQLETKSYNMERDMTQINRQDEFGKIATLKTLHDAQITTESEKIMSSKFVQTICSAEGMERERKGGEQEFHMQFVELENAKKMHDTTISCINQLTMEKSLMEEQNNEHRKTIDTMDAKRDNLEEELDQLSCECQIFKQQIKEAQYQTALAEESSKDVIRCADEMRSSLTDKEREVAYFYRVVDGLKKEKEDICHVLEGRNMSLLQANQDIASMTRESQVVSTECSRITNELMSIKSSLDQTLQRAESAERKIQVMELEKEDFFVNYRTVVDERTALEQSLDELTRARYELSQRLNDAQNDNCRMKKSTIDMNDEIHKRVSEMSGFEQRLDAISRENVALQRKLDASGVENGRLRADLDASRERCAIESRRVLELQHSIAQAEKETKSTKCFLAGVEAEATSLRNYLSKEKKRFYEIESIVASCRTKDAAASEQIRKIMKENAELSTKYKEVLIQSQVRFVSPNVTCDD